MHPSVLAQRKAIATNRIVERATAIVNHLELDPALAAGLQSTVKDTQAAEMIQLEGLANLMDQLAENAGVPAAPAPVNMVSEFIAPAVSTETPAAEELPPPVVE